ncbi:MAG TPA: GtrA family protein [Polyangiaceae bacterium]|jgi:putative flippase GtrA
MWKKIAQLLRAGVAGMAATGADLATLALLVSVFHGNARLASLPALVVGGVVNFLGNRHFAFRARDGHLGKQAAGYTVVEIVALALNGFLYDTVLRLVPGATHVYWLVRLATSHAVFLGWSYPLWRKVFRVAPAPV